MWKTQQPLMVEDSRPWTTVSRAVTPLLRENGVQSYCVVPLTTAFRRLGAMGFGSLQKRAYQEADVSFMQEVAKQVAVAVDNVLHDESARSAQRQLARERDRLRLLLEVNNAVVSHLGLDAVFAPSAHRCSRSSSTTAAACCSTTRRRAEYRCHVLHGSRPVAEERELRRGRTRRSQCMKSPAVHRHHDAEACGVWRAGSEGPVR